MLVQRLYKEFESKTYIYKLSLFQMWLKNLSFQFDNKKKLIQSWPVKLHLHLHA